MGPTVIHKLSTATSPYTFRTYCYKPQNCFQQKHKRPWIISSGSLLMWCHLLPNPLLALSIHPHPPKKIKLQMGFNIWIWLQIEINIFSLSVTYTKGKIQPRSRVSPAISSHSLSFPSYPPLVSSFCTFPVAPFSCFLTLPCLSPFVCLVLYLFSIVSSTWTPLPSTASSISPLLQSLDSLVKSHPTGTSIPPYFLAFIPQTSCVFLCPLYPISLKSLPYLYLSHSSLMFLFPIILTTPQKRQTHTDKCICSQAHAKSPSLIFLY